MTGFGTSDLRLHRYFIFLGQGSTHFYSNIFHPNQMEYLDDDFGFGQTLNKNVRNINISLDPGADRGRHVTISADALSFLSHFRDDDRRAIPYGGAVIEEPGCLQHSFHVRLRS